MAQLGQWPLKHGEVIEKLPGELGGWTIARDLPAVPAQSFREWWRARQRTQGEVGRV
jgi:L-lactate dehydrogenase complex protein LldF